MARITQAERVNAGGRIEHRYALWDRPLRCTYTDPEVYHWGYVYEALREQGLNHETAISSVERQMDVAAGETSAAGPTGRPRPTGRVRLDSRVFADDRGSFLGLGASLFWAPWGYRHDAGRLERDLDWLSRHDFDYVRVLGMVGAQPFWTGREIDPEWADYWDVMAGLADLVFDGYGLRLQPVIFADAQVMMPERERRPRWVDEWARFAERRAEKLVHLEVANEYWQNGLDRDELQRLTARLASQTKVAVAASAPRGHDCATWQGLYHASGATLATMHLDRDRSRTDGAWRPVRQAWHPRGCNGLPPVWTNNEPIGPGSSVAADDDPLRLVMGAVVTFVSQGAGYVFHSSAGVRGLDRLRSVPNAEATVDGLMALRGYLPRDLPNWERHNHHWSGHPFSPSLDKQIWPDGREYGVVRAFAATSGEAFVVAPIGIRGHVDLTARRPLSCDVIDPLTGRVLRKLALDTDQTARLGDDSSAVVLRGRFRT